MTGGRKMLRIFGTTCVALSLYGWNMVSVMAGPESGPATEVHGDLITPAPVNSNQLGQVMLSAESKPRKHAPIPSTQQRMVMYQLKMDQLTDEQPVNSAPPTPAVPTNLPGPGPAMEPLLPGYLGVGFEKLAAFDFALTDALVKGAPQDGAASAPPASQIPEDIRKLDGRQVGIRGFLLPVKMDDGLAVEFLLMRDRSFCCYGAPPKINQWITVHVKGRGVKPVMDQVITVYGTLHVAEMRESGFLVGIYALDADKITGLPD
jgi:hypothetical protein